jgi:hypothetical protein
VNVATSRHVRLEYDADGTIRFGPARRRTVEGIHVLELHGGPYDMARQHGALLADRLGHGPLPFFARALERFEGPSAVGSLRGRVRAALDRLRPSPSIAGLSTWARAVAAGIADGGGRDEAEVLRALVMVDDGLAWAADVERWARLPFAPGSPSPPSVGCTTAVAAGARTERGRLLFAHNLDLFAVGRWDTDPVVAFHHPEEGLAYVGVTAAGIFGGGVSGMNAAGLTVGVHPHVGVRVQASGEAVGLAGDRLLREARTVDEAIALLDRHAPRSGWTYVIADVRRAVAYEVLPGARRFVEMTDGLLGCANLFQHPDLVAFERGLHGAHVGQNQRRQRQVWAKLRGEPGAFAPHTESSMIELLADAVNPDTGREEVLGPSLCRPATVQSVLFRPADQRLWVGRGPAPTCVGEYLGFDLKLRGLSGAPKRLTTREGRDTPRVRAAAAYARSWQAWLEDTDAGAASAAMNEAVTLAPEDARLRSAAGWLALVTGDAARAETHFRASVAHAPDAERRAFARMGLARALEALGRAGEARRAQADAEAEAGPARARLQALARRSNADSVFAVDPELHDAL